MVQAYDSVLRTGVDFSLTEENMGTEFGADDDEDDVPLASDGRSYGFEFMLRRQLGGQCSVGLPTA